MSKRFMTISSEFKNLQKVQNRCISFAEYLEKSGNGRYDDLIMKLACVVGSIEDVLTFDE